ncbi:MAG: tripartite tricarboxylate transporter substrate binding protein [Burkholderiales bacterium]|nr:tripartite tricarboxylate transporter substrate binding protein [Burkholderiales bacterium]
MDREVAARPRKRMAGVAALTAALLAGALHAQSFPSRPIEFNVHTSPGGGTDLFARTVTEILIKEKAFTQPIIVSNRPGGSGAIAFNHVKSRRGDPHVVLTMATGSFLTATVRKELDLGLEHFTPLASFAVDPQVIAVGAESKFRTARDLIDIGRKEPNSVIASITSATGTARLFLYVLEKETGAKFRFVSFKSGSEATTAVAGGHTQFTPENLSEMLGLVEGKKLRVLAVTGEKRLPAVPDAPTLKELGYNIVIGTGRGFVMPAGVPKEALAAMEAALKRAYDSAAWKDFAKRNNFEDNYLGAADWGKSLARQQALMVEFLAHISTPQKP